MFMHYSPSSGVTEHGPTRATHFEFSHVSLILPSLPFSRSWDLVGIKKHRPNCCSLDKHILVYCQKLWRSWYFTLVKKKIACHSFMDVGRRHKFPGSEIKDVILMAQQAAKASDYLYQFPKPKFPNGNEERAKWHLHMGWLFHRKV